MCTKCCNSIFALHLLQFTSSFSTTSDGFWSDSTDNWWDESPHGQHQLSLSMQSLRQVGTHEMVVVCFNWLVNNVLTQLALQICERNRCHRKSGDVKLQVDYVAGRADGMC